MTALAKGGRVLRSLGQRWVISRRRVRAHRYPDVLDLLELAQALDAAGPPRSALLVAAVGPLRGDVAAGVDPDAARLELPNHAVRPREIRRLRKALRPRLVSLAMPTASDSSVNRMTETTGPNVSVSASAVSLPTPAKTVGVNVVAVFHITGDPAATGYQLTHFLVHCLVDDAEDAINGALGDDRADHDRRVERIADRRALDNGDEFLHECFVHGLLDQDPAAAGTALTALAKRAPKRGQHRGGVQVGVGEDQVGRLAAQLGGDRSEVS
jgi:hypothetical protein